ncbi:hypothetical protein AWZ03_002446 [Drosophila navojoa]|uniref:C3H1-type domain-containing protein n=1 Tax=Drosophila navojoa TaxID=7232 RepID=A0A484BQS1_DRONA|nr:hypothetical protein AWZ03_002446 [Drosophila navojoa]
MDMDGLLSILSLFERNVIKLQQNLNTYQVEVNAVRRTLEDSWSHVGRADGRIIAVHDGLLSSVNAVNEHIIKLNLHIDLNRAIGICKNEDINKATYNYKGNHTNLDGIEVGELDVRSGNTKSEDQAEDFALQLITSNHDINVHKLEVRSVHAKRQDEAEDCALQTVTPNHDKNVNDHLKKLDVSVKRDDQPGIVVGELGARSVPAVPEDKTEECTLQLDIPNHDIAVGELDVGSVHAKPDGQIEECVLQLTKPNHDIEETEIEVCLAKPNDQTEDCVPQLATPTDCLEVGKPEIVSVHSKPKDPTVTPMQCGNMINNQHSFTPIAQLLPFPTRQSKLLPPKGGRQMSSNAIYDQLNKNISSFVKGSVMQATMMHLNIADDCIFVARWNEESTPIIKLLECQGTGQLLDQFPDFGEVFVVYDAQERILPRVVINSRAEGGGYDAYLIDYGEHIRLAEDDVILAIPNEVKALPAEAIRCFVRNREVVSMSKFIYKNIQLRVLVNSGNDLEVEILDDGSCEKTTASSIHIDNPDLDRIDEANNIPNMSTEQEPNKSVQKLSPEDLEMLDQVECSTSNALKAVLGYIPTDEKRICRHYDPKINGCFKGSNCRLLHQPFAPNGATKDVELVEPLPETIYTSEPPRQVGSIIRVLVTYISSPTEVYVQFVDAAVPPLVWSKKDVPESQRNFKHRPRLLDIVLALYSDDCFYRAQIIEEIDGLYKIFYVDYGNTEFVSIRSLARCTDDISLKPHQANNCFIGGVKRRSLATQRQTTECVEFLKSRILNVELDVKLIGQMPDGYVIKLKDPYADLPSQMIKRGYVEPIC